MFLGLLAKVFWALGNLVVPLGLLSKFSLLPVVWGHHLLEPDMGDRRVQLVTLLIRVL